MKRTQGEYLFIPLVTFANIIQRLVYETDQINLFVADLSNFYCFVSFQVSNNKYGIRKHEFEQGFSFRKHL